MVTTTLKLGISILNGGNSEVQRVRVLHFLFFKITLGFFNVSLKLTGVDFLSSFFFLFF